MRRRCVDLALRERERVACCERERVACCEGERVASCEGERAACVRLALGAARVRVGVLVPVGERVGVRVRASEAEPVLLGEGDAPSEGVAVVVEGCTQGGERLHPEAVHTNACE